MPDSCLSWFYLSVQFTVVSYCSLPFFILISGPFFARVVLPSCFLNPPLFLGLLLNSLPIALLAPLVQSEPSAPPEGVSCESASSTSLRVSWRPPPEEGQNGELAGFELRYQRVSGAGGGGQGPEMKGLPIPAQQGQTVLEGLEKWSWYNLTMAASTAEGTGPRSPAVLCRTDEDGKSESRGSDLTSIDRSADYLRARLLVTQLIPHLCVCAPSVPGAAPRQVDVQPFNSSALRVTWRSVLPRLRQGQIRGYQVHFSRAESSDSRNLPWIKDLLLDEAQVTSRPNISMIKRRSFAF